MDGAPGCCACHTVLANCHFTLLNCRPSPFSSPQSTMVLLIMRVDQLLIPYGLATEHVRHDTPLTGQPSLGSSWPDPFRTTETDQLLLLDPTECVPRKLAPTIRPGSQEECRELLCDWSPSPVGGVLAGPTMYTLQSPKVLLYSYKPSATQPMSLQ